MSEKKDILRGALKVIATLLILPLAICVFLLMVKMEGERNLIKIPALIGTVTIPLMILLLVLIRKWIKNKNTPDNNT